MTPEHFRARLRGFAVTTQEGFKLERIGAALAELPHDVQVNFWVGTRGTVDGCPPLESLARGHYEQVMAAAVAFTAMTKAP